jgi:hypothetical protein
MMTLLVMLQTLAYETFYSINLQMIMISTGI